MFPLFAGPKKFVRNPYGDKGWNKPGTLETKLFPIRDGNHAPLQLCNPPGENLGKKREKCLKGSAINLGLIVADNVMSLRFQSCPLIPGRLQAGTGLGRGWSRSSC
jgi:hypothetical protein